MVVPQLTKRWPCLGCHGAHNYRVWSTIYFDANKHHHQVCNYGIIQNYKDYFRNKITINEKLEIKYEMKEKKICIALLLVDARSPHTFIVGSLWIAFKKRYAISINQDARLRPCSTVWTSPTLRVLHLFFLIPTISYYVFISKNSKDKIWCSAGRFFASVQRVS